MQGDGMPINSVSFGTNVRRHVPIPMPDGAILSADIFLPDADALDGKRRFPVAFDYYPYRKDDGMAGRTRLHRSLAARGFVAVRIDVRGSGSSTGTAADEYCPQEMDDGVEAIAWLAAQPWSNGNVGMFGSSYGGFNSLQVAMKRPPALKAICPMYFTDNRYTDDCHYKGGSMQMMFDVGTYGLSMVAENALPPSRDALGQDWAKAWDEHLLAEPWLLSWIEHQVWDDYWKHGSLCEDYGAIRAATYLFGGWRDGYATCNLRTFEHLTCPKKVIVGPWGHTWPDAPNPGPAIDFEHEIARFFEHWLSGADNGVMDEPPVTIYVQHSDPPMARRTFTTGEWRHETEWPLARGVERELRLGSAGVLAEAVDAEPAETTGADAAAVSLTYNPGVGTTFGLFGGSSLPSRSCPAISGLRTPGRSTGRRRPAPLAGDPRPRPIDAPDRRDRVRGNRRHTADRRRTGRSRGARDEGRAQPDAPPFARGPDADGARARLRRDHCPRGDLVALRAGSCHPHCRDRRRLPAALAVADAVHHDDFGWRRRPVGGHASGRAHAHGRVPAPDLRAPQPFFELPGFQLEPPSWRVTRDPTRGTVEVALRTNNAVRLADGTLWHTSSEATTSVDEANPALASIVGISTLALKSPIRTTVSAGTWRDHQRRGRLPRDGPAGRDRRRRAVPFEAVVEIVSAAAALTGSGGQWARASMRRHSRRVVRRMLTLVRSVGPRQRGRRSVHDLVITGGSVVDPVAGTSTTADIAIAGGRVVGDRTVDSDEGRDARHRCSRAASSRRASSTCTSMSGPASRSSPSTTTRIHLARGTTTVVDAGSSGANTFRGFRRYVIEPSATRTLAFLHISGMGQLDLEIGELEDIRWARSDRAIDMASAHPDVIVGIKLG